LPASREVLYGLGSVWSSLTWRRRVVPALFVAIAIAIVSTVAVRHLNAFRVSLESRDGAFIATVAGPKPLLERLAVVSESRRHCEFPSFVPSWGFVDWGDDESPPTNTAAPPAGVDGCEDLRRHRYTAPGTYVVKAEMGYLGSTDIPISVWTESITVTVPGAPIAVSDLTLIDVAAGQVFPYQKSIPVEWNLVAGSAADLTLEVVTESGEIAAAQTFHGLRYVGPGKAKVSLNSESYNAVVKPDMVPAHLRATARFGDKQVVREGGSVTLSSQQVGVWDGAPHITVEAMTRTVSLEQTLYNPSCDGYFIDWGDGSPPVSKVALTAPQQGCILEKILVTSRHTYNRPGKYRIMLRVSKFSYKEAPEEAPSYRAFDVEIL